MSKEYNETERGEEGREPAAVVEWGEQEQGFEKGSGLDIKT